MTTRKMTRCRRVASIDFVRHYGVQNRFVVKFKHPLENRCCSPKEEKMCYIWNYIISNATENVNNF